MTAPAGRRPQERRAAAGALVGTTIEWYDFFVYSTSASLVLASVFFPSEDDVVGLLAIFSTFFVAFLARPIGAVLFGHLGDRWGRRRTLLVTLFLMGAATVGIGLLPGYATWGITSCVLLVLLRITQGISVGGEWGGAVLLSVEHAGRERKSFLGSWPQWGSPLGLLLSTLMIALATTVSGDAYATWGWRIPFLFSGVLFVVGLVIRLAVEETPDFAAAPARAAGPSPLREVLTRHPVALLLLIGMFAYSLGGYYITTTYTVSYLEKEVGAPRWVGLGALIVAAVCQLVGSVVGGLVADRSARARRLTMTLSLAALVPVALVFFALVGTGVVGLVWLAVGVSQLLQGLFYGPAAALAAQMFPVSARYTGVSLGYQGSALVLGATAPFVATALVAVAGGSALVTVYLAMLAALSACAVTVALRRLTHAAAAGAPVGAHR